MNGQGLSELDGDRVKEKENSCHSHTPWRGGPRMSSLRSSLCYLDSKKPEGSGLCLSVSHWYPSPSTELDRKYVLKQGSHQAGGSLLPGITSTFLRP